jgi:hypothetical protein
MGMIRAVPAATVERPLVGAPEKAAVFMARRADLKLVLKRKWDRKDGEGNVIETIPGEHVKFDAGVLRVPRTGKLRGEHGEELDAAEVLTALLGDEGSGKLPHRLLGDRFDGFWLHEEPAPAPTEDERNALAELVIELDVDGIERFIGQEEAGWVREGLLTEARTSLERVRAKVDARDAELAKARAEGEAAVKAPRGGAAS